MSSFSSFCKELYYGTLLFCSGRWEVCHLRSEEISLYIRCLLSALQPWHGRARADDFWMRLRYGTPDHERMSRRSWTAFCGSMTLPCCLPRQAYRPTVPRQISLWRQPTQEIKKKTKQKKQNYSVKKKKS